MIEIRQEIPADAGAIRDVNLQAFGGDAEAQLVDMLRAAKKATVSLVAVDQGHVVGHVLFSPVTIAEAPDGFRALGLAPMSVIPAFQNRGIGSRLVRDGLEACRRQAYDLVVVLGHTNYYPRFGFHRASDYHLDNEYNASSAFMALALTAEALQRARGLVKYAAEFKDAGC